jgi:uncharacterized membrane protein
VATVIGLGVQFSANANGMTKGLSQVDRQLLNLGKQVSDASRLFDGFAKSSGSAAAAQQQVATDVGFLTSAFKTGQLSAEEFAENLRDIAGSAREQAAAFAEGARLTEQTATAEERRVAQLQRLDDLLAAGAISQETYSRAVGQASGAAAAAAAATAASERDRARVIAEGATLTASVQNVQEKRAAELQRLAGLLSAGAISEETYARAVTVASGAQSEAEAGERSRQQALAEGARIAEQTATAEERRVGQLERLGSLLEQGAIDAEVYGRAVASSTAGFDGTQAERFAQAIAPLQERLQAGSISFEEFSRQASGISDAVSGATSSSQRSEEAILALKQRFDAGAISIEEYRTQFSQIQAGNISSQLSVEVLGVREGVAASEQLQAAIAGLQGKQIDAVLELSGVESLDDLRTRLDGIDGRQVDALLSVLGVETVEDARQRLESIDGTQVEAQLRVIGFESINDARAAVDSLQDRSVTASLDFFGTDSIEDVRSRINSLDGATAEAFLKVSGFDSIEQAQEKLASLTNVDVTAFLSLLGVDTIDDARQRLATLDGTEVLAQLQTAGFESIEQAQSLINSLEGKDITVLAESLGVDSVEQLTAVINAVESRTVTLDAETNADETSAAVKSLVDEQREYQQLVQEASRITQKYTSDEERRAAAIAQIERVNATGALSEEVYARAIEDASGAKEEAARAAQEYASQQARAAAIVEANLSTEERASRDYAAAITELDRLRDSGLIGEQDYAKAVDRSAAAYAKATAAASSYDDAAKSSGDAGLLKFSELSGVLAAIPGPIGNVAGRLSGLSSAGEGLGKVFGGGAGLSGGLANIGASVAGLVNPFTVGLAAVAAFGAGASAVASGLIDLEDRVEKLGNTADKLGVSFEFIQLLEEAGNRSGVSIESVSTAFGKLQKTLAGADEESKAATAALAKLGIAFTDLENLSPEEQIRLIGEQLQGIDDPAKRTAAAMQIFGKSGADLLPFFAQLGPAADDIERLGGSLTAIDRSRIDDFGNGIDALGVASSRLGELLLLPFVGLGEGIAQGSAEFLGGINAIVGPIGDVLQPVLAGLGTAFEVVGVVIGGIGRVIGEIISPIGDLAQAFGAVGEAFNTAFVDVVRYLVDGEVAASDFAMSFTPLGAVADNLGAIGETVSRVANIIGTALSQVGDYIGGVLASWAEFFGLESAIESIGGLISSVFGGVSSTFETISNAIGGTVGRLLTIAENFLGITAEVETAITPELDLSQPSLAASQFAKDIGAAATAAAEFGQAGFQAALSYQNSLEQIAQLQADGTLTADEAKKAAEQEKAAFEAKIATLDREAQAQASAAEAARKAADEKIAAAERAAAAAVDADRKLADAFITAQGLGGGGQVTAADTLLAIVRQIEETEAAIVDARAAGDTAAEQAAIRRLAVLDQAQAAAEESATFGFSTQDAERAIASVREGLDDAFSFVNFELAPEAFTAAQEQLAQLEADLEAKVIDPETFEQAADAIRSGFEDALKTAERIRDLNEQYAQRAAEIDAERIDALSKVSQQTVQATDVRTSEGASEFLRLATGREDPAISEYRKQLSELQKIAREIGKLGGVVDIVGAA